MATHVLAEVLQHSCAEGGDRLVLIVLADEASKETREACCSVQLISEHARLSERAVQYSLKRLVALGEISIVRAIGRGNNSLYRIHKLPIVKGANFAPFSDADATPQDDIKGANVAPFPGPEKVQMTTLPAAEKVQMATKKGANGDIEKVQITIDTYSVNYSVISQQKNTLSSNAARSSTERAIAQALLNELNRRTFKRTGYGFRPTSTNLNLVLHRVRETDAETVLAVMRRKIAEWWNTEMEKYLRPATLCGAEKFSQYVGELGTKLRRKDGREPRQVFTPEQLAILNAPPPAICARRQVEAAV